MESPNFNTFRSHLGKWEKVLKLVRPLRDNLISKCK